MRLPVKLVFSEQFTTREEALACERLDQKGLELEKKKEALMRRDWAELSRLGRQGPASRTSERVAGKAHTETVASKEESFDKLRTNGIEKVSGRHYPL